ncbi:MAG: DUF2231 domain-containing protein [Calditrichia bacterium]
MLHPVIVHFAIALLSTAIVLDLLYLLSGKEQFRQVSKYLLIAGTLSAVGAVLSGNHEVQSIQKIPEFEQLIESHQTSGTWTMWIFIAVTILRFVFEKFRFFSKPLKWIYYLLGVIALVFLFRTGFLGGEMVYIHGIGTSQTKKAPLSKPSFER